MRAIAPVVSRRRWLAALVLVFASLAIGRTATAQEPVGSRQWSRVSEERPAREPLLSMGEDADGEAWLAPLGQQRPALTCEQLDLPNDSGDYLTLSDADLLIGGDGSQFCLFFDALWNSYYVALLNIRGIQEFRAAKARFQPLIGRAGINTCEIGFWSTPDRTIGRSLSNGDLKDAGRRCTPEIFAHGPGSAARAEEARGFVSAAVAKGEELFRWPLSWPLRVHLYDDHSAFLSGLQTEAGDPGTTERSIRFTFARTETIANGMEGFLVDLANFPEPADLQMLISHEYAHVVQGGALGGPSTLPFFVTEGGAEFFASRIVGPEQRYLARRYRDAAGDERAERAFPLRELVARPDSSDQERSFASYSRGYAAMLLLTSRWGIESFGRLQLDNKNGTPAHYLEGLAALTGLSLDDFDKQVSAYLRDPANTPSSLAPLPTESPAPALTPRASAAPTASPRPSAAPATAPPASPRPNGATPAPAATPRPAATTVIPAGSRLVDLIAARARPTGSAPFEPVSTFGAGDRSVFVFFHWNCLDHEIQGEARVIAPDGQAFAIFSGTDGPGCVARATSLELVLDESFGGQTARSQPGAWRVEVYADGVLQGTVPFTLTG